MKYMRYMNAFIGIWSGKQEELKEGIKKMEDKMKGIKLELGCENHEEADDKFTTPRWYQKECHTGIYFNRCNVNDDTEKCDLKHEKEG